MNKGEKKKRKMEKVMKDLSPSTDGSGEKMATWNLKMKLSSSC